MNLPIESGPAVPPRFAAALRFWLLLGCISFGGPAGQIAIMHAELVEKRRWIGEGAFLRALDFCMLLPGPEAMQLATWLGWRLHGVRGGIAAGALFVLPAAVLMALLSWAYLAWHASPVVGGVVFGLQAAVLGIIVHAVQRIGGRVLRTPFAVALAAFALLAISVGVSFPLLILAAAACGWLAWRVRPRWLPQADTAIDAHAPVSRAQAWRAACIVAACLVLWWLPVVALGAWLGTGSTAFAMGVFFGKTSLLTLGGAYAVLPYVATQAVEVHGWLTPAQMMTGLGLAETTPGPLILVLEFVGFAGAWQHPDLASPLASGMLGAAVAVWATFLPSFLFVLGAAPWIEAIGRWPRASAVLAGVTAAVVGVIAHLALWFGWRLLAAQGWVGGVLVLAIAAGVYAGLARGRWPRTSAVLAGVTAAVVGVIAHLALWFGWRLLAAHGWAGGVLALGIAVAVYAGLARGRWPVAVLVPAAGLLGALAHAWLPLPA